MNREKPVKLVFVGGHHTPALAVIDALEKRFKIYWIGHKYTLWGDKNPGAEYGEVTARSIPFFDLKAGKFYRTFHPLKLLRLPFGFLQAFYYLWVVRPRLIVSFGGYLAVPVAFAGWLLRVPVITHEQTLRPGLANRLLARLAVKICVSWAETAGYFPKGKTILTGNPLRPSIYQVKHPLSFSGERKSWLTLYITGGKQGAHFLNEITAKAMPVLLESFNVVHQCGSASLFNDYAHLNAIKEKLPADLKKGFLLQRYFDEEEIGAVYASTSLVISRAGANTVYELLALGKPALLIPLRRSSGGEQERNAQKLVEAGLAKILFQEQLTPESLIGAVEEMKKDLGSYQTAVVKARQLVVFDADRRIANEITKLLVLE